MSLQLNDPIFFIRIKYVNADKYVIDRQRQKDKVYTRYPIVARALGLVAASREQRYLAYKRSPYTIKKPIYWLQLTPIKDKMMLVIIGYANFARISSK